MTDDASEREWIAVRRRETEAQRRARMRIWRAAVGVGPERAVAMGAGARAARCPLTFGRFRQPTLFDEVRQPTVTS